METMNNEEKTVANETADMSEQEIIEMFGMDDDTEVVPERIPSISIDHSEHSFRMSDNRDSKTSVIEGAIVYDSKINAHWQGKYLESEPSIPLCFSTDGITPEDNVADKQAESCTICPKNKYGSDDGGKGKACRNMRLLHILINGGSLVYSLTLPPSSLKSWNTYSDSLRKQKVPLPAVITQIGLEKRSYGQGVEFSSITLRQKSLVKDKKKLLEIKKLVDFEKEAMHNKELVQAVPETQNDDSGIDFL